jgi:hypothetical protein
VRYEKEVRKEKVKKIKKRAIPKRKQRFVVGEPEDTSEDEEEDFEILEDEPDEGPPSFITSMENMSLRDRLKGLADPVDDIED